MSRPTASLRTAGSDLSAGPVLTVDLAAVAHNTRLLAAHAPALMAVVKADAFGHGAAAVARTALAHGAVALGVASAAEATALRAAGFSGRVLSWLNAAGADLRPALTAGIELAFADETLLDAVAVAARSLGVTARLHLHVDTGMAREGAAPQRWLRLCARVREHEAAGAVRLVGVMGHLARASEPADPSNARAVRALEQAVEVARSCGLRPAVRHLAATAATLELPATRLDLVRVGAGLYGFDATGGHGLRRAARLTAPVIAVRDVAAGTGVGYGHTFRTAGPTRLALLGVGYADGVPPAAAGRAWVALAGRRCPVVGAVSMDQVVVDVGPAQVRPGQVAVLFGTASDEPTTADWARWCGVPEQAVTAGVGPRVRRVHLPATAGPTAGRPRRASLARATSEGAARG